ncbi:aspartyl protease [Acrodontium crateriforme]|uniref:Aspartyl protease n=1 Tax=Acrodontium crateriforme TaxID=150365 RepID=A0AAQ3M9N9_9PEZI|nr:aspartyl protease [Acrodontium crateriforme]
MPSFAQVSIALFAFTALVSAAPTETSRQSDGGIRLNQIAAGYSVKSGHVALAQALQKYKLPVPEKVAARAAADLQKGSVTTTPQENDIDYLTPVTIGRNTLNLDIDTGSSDLWVLSTKSPKDLSSGHKLYNPSTGKLVKGATWSIFYADFSFAEGIVYTDKVSVGGVAASKQAVEVAIQASGSFVSNKPSSGLLGLAFSQGNTIQPVSMPTFFDSIRDSLPQKLFAVDLKYHAPGTYDFGFIDSTKYKGEITWTKVWTNELGPWGFNAGGVSVGSAKVGTEKIGRAIADTGTSLLLTTDDAASTYWKAVKSAKNDGDGWEFNCTEKLPKFNVEIEGTTFTIPGKYMNYALDSDTGKCYGGIQGGAGQESIFGDVFLKAVYAIFENKGKSDGSSARLGFAKQV